MNPESKDPNTQPESQTNDNSPASPAYSGSDQNRSGIMDNDMGKTDDIFEDENVPNEGEVGNTGNNPNVFGNEKGNNEITDPKPVNEDEDEDMDNIDDVEADEDFDLEDVDLDDTDLNDDALQDLDEEDDIDEDEEEDSLM